MRRFLSVFYVYVLLILYSFISCASIPKTDRNNLNTTLPPLLDDFYTENSVIEPPSSNSSNDYESEEWDVSDVDISYVDSHRKLIAFSFDDAPANELENICAVFAHFNEENPDCKGSATFFCNGNRLDERICEQAASS